MEARERWGWAFCFALAALAIGYGLGNAVPWPVSIAKAKQATASPAGGVAFNEQFAAGMAGRLDLSEPERVFEFVFSRLPDSVRVLPTENYYYFSFTASGRQVSGNLRLSPEDRDKGVLHFAYFEVGDIGGFKYRKFDDRSAVSVRKVGGLRYEVAYRDRTVRFALNDLPQDLPEGFELEPGEELMGRCFDESGFQLLLIYAKPRKHFLFALDPSQGVDWGFKRVGEKLLIHPSSRWAFYDAGGKRRLLIGVYLPNVDQNTYFDGPFDQLPDNFIGETPFAEYVQEAYPYTQGRIDSHGRFLLNGERGRMAITPYREYTEEEEMVQFVAECEKRAEDRADLYSRICLDDKAGASGTDLLPDTPAGVVHGKARIGGTVIEPRSGG
jgi:hypothetical protein